MDVNFDIYRDHPDNIPPEDSARLEGYLEGRSEDTARREFERKLAEIKESI